MSTIFEEDLKSISDEIVKLGIIHKTIFLTGATGLVGSAIAKGILYSNQYGADNRVVALIRNEDKANWIYKEYIGDNHLTLIKGDVNQPFKYIYLLSCLCPIPDTKRAAPTAPMC